MKNIPNNITCIVSIDRINISAHKSKVDKFINKLREMCTLKKMNKLLNYYVYMFYFENCRVQIYHKIKFNPIDEYERFYIQLLQPNFETQEYIKNLLIETCSCFCLKQLNPTVRAVEIAHDFYTENDYDLHGIHALLAHNLNIKYARTGSVGWFKNTSYRGKDRYIRKGSKGSRTYIKLFKNGKSACRFEIQLNARYLHDKCFTIECFPLQPDKLDALSGFEVLDNFSDKGIENLARSILRKRGKRVITRSKKFKFKLPIMMQWLQREIFGAWHEDDYASVPEQIDRVKAIKKKYGLAINQKLYFHPLFDLNETMKNYM